MDIHHDSPTTTPFLQWEFEREQHHLMCAVRATPAAFEVETVPLWDVALSAMETFGSASAALRRHAAIASELRDTGWTVAAYTV